MDSRQQSSVVIAKIGTASIVSFLRSPFRLGCPHTGPSGANKLDNMLNLKGFYGGVDLSAFFDDRSCIDRLELRMNGLLKVPKCARSISRGLSLC